MEIIQNSRRPHDKFVKNMLSDLPVAIDFFEANLPKEICDELELETLSLEQGTFVDTRLQARYTDVLYKSMLKRGGEGYLYLLVEHYSSPDPVIAFKVLNYVMRILDKHVKDAESAERTPLPLPCVFVTVLYNGERAYKGTRKLFKLFGDYAQVMEGLFTGDFNLVDVSLEANQELRGQRWASLMAWCMRHSMQREFLPYLSDFGLFLKDVVGESKLSKSGINRIEVMLYYISMSMNTAADSDTLIEALYEKLPLELENIMATLGQQLIAKGEARGEARGKVEGISGTLDAITLIQQDLDNEAIVRRTGLDLKTIQTLRAKLLH